MSRKWPEDPSGLHKQHVMEMAELLPHTRTVAPALNLATERQIFLSMSA
jgi:hypothetical protein